MSVAENLFPINTNVSMKEFFSTNAEKIIQAGDVLEGVITEIYNDEARIDIGSKSEGVIPIDELKDSATGKLLFKKGEKVLVYVLVTETKDGKILLSSSKAQVEKLWFELEEVNKNNNSIDVKIVEANRGGLIGVYKNNLRGFIPLSQLTIHHRPKLKKGDERDANIQNQLQKLINSTLSVRIIEVDSKRNRLIFSERAAAVSNPNLLNEISVGQQLIGKISNILKFGLFIDLGGFDGFVHISEISWNRIQPDDLFVNFKIGQPIKVVVIDVDERGKRVSLSIKQLSSNPWSAVASKYFVGQILDGVISAVADFGLFVELEKNFEGLLHISELKNTSKEKLSADFQVGQKIQIKISSIDTEKKRLSLSQANSSDESSPKAEVIRKGEESKLAAKKEKEPKLAEKEDSQEDKKVSTALNLSVEREEVVKKFMELEGVGKTIAQRLYEAGYKTLKGLAKASLSELSLVPGIRRSLADKIIKKANSQN